LNSILSLFAAGYLLVGVVAFITLVLRQRSEGNPMDDTAHIFWHRVLLLVTIVFGVLGWPFFLKPLFLKDKEEAEEVVYLTGGTD
jgi:hypothetical protein